MCRPAPARASTNTSRPARSTCSVTRPPGSSKVRWNPSRTNRSKVYGPSGQSGSSASGIAASERMYSGIDSSGSSRRRSQRGPVKVRFDSASIHSPSGRYTVTCAAGVRTGATSRSGPSMYCVSSVRQVGSSGNSKVMARMRGQPCSRASHAR